MFSESLTLLLNEMQKVEVDFSQVKVGDQYLYEESWMLSAYVTILEDLSYKENDKREEEGVSQVISYVVRIDEVINSVSSRFIKGEEFEFGYRVGYEHYKPWKLLEIEEVDNED